MPTLTIRYGTTAWADEKELVIASGPTVRDIRPAMPLAKSVLAFIREETEFFARLDVTNA